MKTSVATATAGILKLSSVTESCKLHEVQDPQSARASITPAAPVRLRINSSGAGLV